jgi:hypothetical protein
MTLEQLTDAVATLDSQRQATDAALHELTARVVKLESNPTALTVEQIATIDHVKAFLGK